MIASGQSITATSAADMRLNGATLTVSSGATFDLTNGGTQTGFIGGLFGGDAVINIESATTVARVDT